MGVFFILMVDLLKTSPHSHLGHINNCHSDDNDDVLQRSCNFTVRANNVFLFFQDTGYAHKNKIVQVILQ